MNGRDFIHNTDEFREIIGEGQQAVETDRRRRAETPQQAVEPIVSLEKSDVQFWIQVAQLVLLYLILRELSRGGA